MHFKKFEYIYRSFFNDSNWHNILIFKLQYYNIQYLNYIEHTKISHRIQYILFYIALQEFEYIYCSFSMTQTGTKFWYVFKLHRSNLHTKINHRIQNILCYTALQEFIYIYCSFLMTEIGTKFRYVFKLHWSDLHTKISHCI